MWQKSQARSCYCKSGGVWAYSVMMSEEDSNRKDRVGVWAPRLLPRGVWGEGQQAGRRVGPGRRSGPRRKPEPAAGLVVGRPERVLVIAHLR